MAKSNEIAKQIAALKAQQKKARKEERKVGNLQRKALRGEFKKAISAYMKNPTDRKVQDAFEAAKRKYRDGCK